MIKLLIIALIGWIITAYLFSYITNKFGILNGGDLLDEVFRQGLSVFVSFILWFIIFFYMMEKIEDSDKELILSHTIEIAALKDNSNINGRSSYLGSGRVNEEQYYYFMRNTNKGKKMVKIKADKSYIKEGDYRPEVKVYDAVLTEKWAIWLHGDKLYKDEAEYIFYVPENTVTTDFSIDME